MRFQQIFYKTQKGVTIIELMIVVMLMAIFAAFAVPSMGDLITRQRLQSAAVDVANLMGFARNEAARIGKPVYVIPSRVRSDGKILPSPSNATEPYNWNGDSKTPMELSVTAYADDFSNVGNMGLYGAGEEVRSIKLSTDHLGIRVMTGSAAEGVNTYTNKNLAGFVFQSDGLMRIRANYSSTDGMMGVGGQAAKVIVYDKNYVDDRHPAGKYCRVVYLTSGGYPKVCQPGESVGAEKTSECYCNISD